MTRDCCNKYPCNCDCKDGPVGPQGLDGPDGDAGAQGPQGSQGAVGPQGDQGIVGPEGPVGDQGAAGIGGSPIQGPQGPDGYDGPIGPDGPQGPDGLDGTNGVDGFDNTCFPTAGNGPINGPAACVGPVYAATTEVPCTVTSAPATCWFSVIVDIPTGGWLAFMIDPIWNPSIGDKVTVYGKVNCGKWSIGIRDNGIIEMAAYNSTVLNRTTNSPNAFIPPYWAYGDRQMTVAQSNGSDCITLLHTGDDLWVVLEANLASEQIPTFT